MPRAPILKSNPFILLPLFFKEYLNHQVRVNKMVNEHRVNYYFSPSVLTSSIHPLIYIQNFCWILCRTCFSHHGWEYFQIFGVQIMGRCILLVKKLKIVTLTHAPCTKPSSDFLSSPPGREKLLIPTYEVTFCRKSTPQQKREKNGRKMEGKCEDSVKLTIRSVNRFRCYKSKE